MNFSIAESVTKEAIALLIDLAERGEIDPWDVQVIDVVDRFLSRLVQDDRRDLNESGQAFLYASMLVLLKANTLSQTQLAQESEADDLTEDTWSEADGVTNILSGLPKNLEDSIRRRPVALPPLARRITLDELIAQLEEIAAIVEQKSGKVTPRARQPKVARQAAMRAIAALAHKENLSEIILELERYFIEKDIADIEISSLAEAFNDRVGVFWGLLFLSAQSKVELFQSEFYGKIQVVPLYRIQETADPA